MFSLVVQSFGNGRTAALMIGDFWQWYARTEETNDDLFKAWRQTMRWLTADVPRRAELDFSPAGDSAWSGTLQVRVRDETYQPDEMPRSTWW